MTKKKYPPMNLANMTPSDKENFEHFSEELKEGSDRSVAIVGHTYIHEILKKLLEKRLIGSEPGEFEKYSFSVCVKTCFHIGIISDTDKFIFMKINDIRNRFAHNILIKSFDDSSIKEMCGLIADKLVDFNGQGLRHTYENARECFVETILLQIFFLTLRLSTLKKIGFWLNE